MRRHKFEGVGQEIGQCQGEKDRSALYFRQVFSNVDLSLALLDLQLQLPQAGMDERR